MNRNRHQWLADLQSFAPAVRDVAWQELSQIAFKIACFYLHHKCDGVPGDEIESLAWDAVQEALIDIMINLDSFRGDSKFTTWVYQYVLNNAREQVRKRYPARECAWQSLNDDQETIVIETARDPQARNPQHTLEDEELLNAVLEIIITLLSKRQREFLLMHIKGFSRKEIAAQHQTTRNNVDQHLFAARKRLKKELRKRGFGARPV